MILTVRLLITAALVLIAASAVFAQKTDRLAEWETFDFTKQVATQEQLKQLSMEELKLVRGIVFGKHGRVFDERFIQDWLKKRPWYKPSAKYKVTDLNDNERANMDAIKEAEWKKHGTIEPGDLKFYRNRLIKPSELGSHTGTEWRIMRAEIEAIHGKRFDAEPELQAFFDERYWYHPDAHYNPKSLAEIERKNLATLAAAHKKQRSVQISPGDMEYFEGKRLSPAMLHGLSLHELRLLRNEIYARKGQKFKTDWLAEYFAEEPWYNPTKTVGDVTLSPIEERNVATILKVEKQLHEQVSKAPISVKLVQGMSVEDVRRLRNEIYARRGKVFKSKILNSYFGSFDWYKPDPGYDETALSSVEKKNERLLLAYERRLAKEIRESSA
jgi:hypothetical protein